MFIGNFHNTCQVFQPARHLEKNSATMSDSKPSHYEKRQNRKAIRALHKAIQENDLDGVRERLESLEVDVNFHYGGQSALQIAVISGNTDICLCLIEHGADVDKYNADENTLLNMATWRGYKDIVKLLVKNNAELDVCNNHGSTALNSATYKGYAGIVKALIEADCDVNKPNLSGQTPLFTSAKENHVEVVRLLLSSSECSIDRRDNDRRSPLYIAAERGYVEIVQMLIKAGADLNAQEKYGVTALCIAAKAGHQEIVGCLVKGGAELNIMDTRKNSPFWEAVENRHIEIVKCLADVGCDMNIAERENGQTPMYTAVRQACQYFMGMEDHLAVVKLLLSLGASVNDADKFGWTPLSQSAFTGEMTLTDLLLNAGAKLDVQSDSGDTPLHYSIYGNKPELVARLIKEGSHVNALNKNNELPLYKAIDTRATIKIVSQLLEAGSLVDICEAEHQQSPLFAAIMNDYSEAVQLLIKYNCDVNLPNNQGDTALWVACDRGHEPLIKLLLEHPDIDIDKGVEHVPLHSAVVQGYEGIAETLLKAGADVNKMSELGSTALYLACDTNRLALINLLAKWGANPSAPHNLTPPQKCCQHYSDKHPHLEMEPLYAAVKNDNFQAVKMVLAVTPRMPYWVLRTLKDLIFRTGYAQEARLGPRTIVQYATFFSGILSKPRCLQEECRGTIRETLGNAPFLKASKLPLPSRIQDYVVMKELFNYDEEMEYFKDHKKLDSLLNS